jgi:hypothetical protein
MKLQDAHTVSESRTTFRENYIQGNAAYLDSYHQNYRSHWFIFSPEKLVYNYIQIRYDDKTCHSGLLLFAYKELQFVNCFTTKYMAALVLSLFESKLQVSEIITCVNTNANEESNYKIIILEINC